MTYPYGGQHYDEDGLPIQNPGGNQYRQPNGAQHPDFQAPYAHPQQGFQPMYGQQPFQGGYPQQYSTPQMVPYAPKSWVVATVLAFFLGSFGAHNFYLGYKNRGMTQLVLLVGGWLTSFLLIGLPVLFALYIWVFIEFLMILVRGGKYATDANGLRLD